MCITRNFGGSAPIVSERVRNRVAESDFLWKDITFNITASLGVAELEATMQACDERLDDADSALSVAEERRNRVVTKRVSA